MSKQIYSAPALNEVGSAVVETKGVINEFPHEAPTLLRA